ncbi:MAG: helix-turn-helix domain-containing protein [Dysgonomonas sp.]
MELLYVEEHLDCLNYDNSLKPAIEVKKIIKRHPFDEQSRQCKIIILLEGNLKYSQGISTEIELSYGQMLLLPPDKNFTLKAIEYEAKILIIRLTEAIRFCECYLVKTLLHQTKSILTHEATEGKRKPFLLRMNDEINVFTKSLLMCVKKGLKCKYYFETKTKELFYLFRAFYTKEELALFFREILNADLYFFYFVKHNYKDYRTVSEFASALNMTLQSFEKQFKTIFKMPAYKWMVMQKASNIHNAICTEQGSFKEIASSYGFSSKSSFSDFCKKNLGKTHGQIRANIQMGGNDEHKKQNA